VYGQLLLGAGRGDHALINGLPLMLVGKQSSRLGFYRSGNRRGIAVRFLKT
jgi:hypothetical protein